MNAVGEGRDWQVSWDGHRIAQIRDLLTLSVEKRVEWLEAMLADARRSGALRAACERREQEHRRIWERG
jgi:hypothetical protein